MEKMMHKVKDAMTGHHNSESKEYSHDPSNRANKMDDNRENYSSSMSGNKDHGSSRYNSSAMDSTNPSNYTSTIPGVGGLSSNRYDTESKMSPQVNDTSNAYDNAYRSVNKGSGGYGSGNQREPNMPSRMDDITHGNSNTGMSDYGTSGYTSGQYASRKGPGGYDSSTMGSNVYDSSKHTGNYNTDSVPYEETGRYGSNNINAGPRESKMTSNLDSRFDGNLDNRHTYGATTTGNTTSTGQMGDYSSNVSSTGGSNLRSDPSHGYNTRSGNTGSNMTSQTGNRAESEVNNRASQQGFGGTAAGGSSYNTHETGKRRTSGPHSSNLLNKLDPRVRSSDYEGNISGNQRGL
ncbi:uncharacterized protein N7459_008637 [Penicillium hispanicum]|uniref:Uncharacterized protein n=1 Tax=Penicillium cinerascens TaxID=70096 RepID=A0A9W9MEF2_9EURO|nr:uncharacterized protein N7459_008637 [Penicillium hispanicum]XP_058307232.1 uncharacterized protein N7498_007921 [Penicillium cinerascens]KAJ5198804.1 hypothetical protein N7498_007921 [Penicillium cinerascens]KAJ5574210.1 hypothetical protein N7459_008637 [Penicillium hispanicum]